MKKMLLLPLLSLFLITGCSSDDNKAQKPLEAKIIMDVAYGNQTGQDMDVYLPAGRTNTTKVIVLVHGGSWVAGDKADMDFMVPVLQQAFPNHAIVNLNYRLASNISPAYPKQTDDIRTALNHLEDAGYSISDDYAFVGVSAGAHLSMLYSYALDTDHDIKAVCNIVGPADFTDPAYLEHEMFELASLWLIGTTNPGATQIEAVNPVAHITAQSPPTITFYGGVDPLVPASQGPRLKAKLDEFGVYNEFSFYPDGGHADWNPAIMEEVTTKVTAFLQAKL